MDMDWLSLLTESWWHTTEGITTIIAAVVGGITTVAGAIIKLINEYRRSNHTCPIHCVTKNPLKPRKKNGKPEE